MGAVSDIDPLVYARERAATAERLAGVLRAEEELLYRLLAGALRFICDLRGIDPAVHAAGLLVALADDVGADLSGPHRGRR